jgi:hypothetical protein
MVVKSPKPPAVSHEAGPWFGVHAGVRRVERRLACSRFGNHAVQVTGRRGPVHDVVCQGKRKVEKSAEIDNVTDSKSTRGATYAGDHRGRGH